MLKEAQNTMAYTFKQVLTFGYLTSFFIFLGFFFVSPVEAGIYDHDDVLIIVNDNSATSTEIGEYFRVARGMSEDQIIHIATLETESVSRTEFETNIRTPIEDYITTNGLTDTVNYLVTTKGVPLRINGTPNGGDENRASVDQELMLILGSLSIRIGGTGSYTSPYYTEEAEFARTEYDMYLVTRLTAYTIDQVKSLIDRSAIATTTNVGNFVLDVDPNRDTGAYQQGNDWMRDAESILSERGYNVLLDETTTYMTNQDNLLGYYSWGSNDCCEPNNGIPNNTYVNGSIAETIVSSSGRTFQYPPTYGQSLIADLIAEGVTGVAGYTTEPLVTAIAHADILFDRYTKGYNLAESFGMSTNHISWKQVVVGDPKMVAIKQRAFDILTPAHEDISTTTTPTFTWEEMESYYGLDSYDLYIDDVLFESDISSENVTISSPLTVGEHTWYVVGKSNDGGQTTSKSTFTLNVYPSYTQGDEIYVDNVLGSNNGNSGSMAEPFATINKATSIAQPGDTIVVIKNDGVPYREGVISNNPGDEEGYITLRGVSPQEKPEIWASDDVSGGWIPYGGGNPDTYQRSVDSSAYLPTFAAGLSMDNLVVRPEGASEDTLNEGEWYYTNGTLYMRTISPEDPNSLHIEFSTRDYGINMQEYVSLADIIVRFAGNTAFALQSNTIATRIEAYQGLVGISTTGGDSIDISYSYASENNSYGFYLLAHNSSITNCTAYQNTGGLGILLLANNTEVINNYFFDNTVDVNAVFGTPPTGLIVSNNAWSNPSQGTWNSYLGDNNQPEITTQSTNTYTSDSSLTSTSTLINAGYDTGITVDVLGNHIFGRQDIGAFEYQWITPSVSFLSNLDGKQITLIGTSTDLDGTVDSILWDFGDGNTDTSLDTTHTYTDYGTYVVTFTAIDNHGAEGIATKTITLSNPSSGGGGGGGSSSKTKRVEKETDFSCDDPLATNYLPTFTADRTLCTYKTNDNSLPALPLSTQRQIDELLKRIQELRTLLNFLKGISSPVSFSPGNCTFYRDLKVDMEGPDVKCLQQYLNSNGFTITNDGPGSLGEETQYFGALTKTALIKFQNANAKKILHPYNLNHGTGYFGQGTREFINNN
ncbi:TIGR03790 family protein [Candidatus Nomurabacteria bacterium]|nr:TIGR03790 family protein [Candidatus Nomurabacteria bacterium]